ncbi:hypothetical protein F751_5258 [Auxenochlorella protothecoides]|uniref:Uncharacterized protein n=1 Tax=Auxenochlorella protothecoides TaxID=3075 RepID=A0A087SQB8_AUXPR|nr:hypothetical protein F751_5258 [Auxenochlorella protothecoides]KFM27922.1 hypothetical protein F751_5258 [Auxenochlorella protothecoides]
MGSIQWAMRGPKSRAGLMATPVGPPSTSTMRKMKKARVNPNCASNSPLDGSYSWFPRAAIMLAMTSRVIVPMNSQRKFQWGA